MSYSLINLSIILLFDFVNKHWTFRFLTVSADSLARILSFLTVENGIMQNKHNNEILDKQG